MLSAMDKIQLACIVYPPPDPDFPPLAVVFDPQTNEVLVAKRVPSIELGNQWLTAAAAEIQAKLDRGEDPNA